MRRNLVSISSLVKADYGFNIDLASGIKISRASAYLGSAILVNDYWQLCCSYPKQILLVENSVNLSGTKRKFNDKSAYLWHRRLGHISKPRLQLLVKENILPELDFGDFDICVECVKGKTTKSRRKEATRSSQLLELIHTDICGNKYFITFINDFSRYCYVYLMSEK